MKKNILIVALVALSLMGARFSSDQLIQKTLDHFHSASQVYPTLAVGVNVTGGAQWTLGNYAEIVPAATIGQEFTIHWLSIEDLDTNAVYEIVLYAATTEIGRVRVTKNANLDGTMNIPFQTNDIAPGTQIQAKVADSSGGGGAVVKVAIVYHLH